MNDAALFIAVFLACIVEAVEATTIVLAAGATRHWRSALLGLAAGLVVLAVAVAVVGPSISLLPIGILRLIVGGLLLVFGLQWMRKAILRASGYKALHDEELIYKKQVAEAAAAVHETRGMVKDWYAFTLSFKGVVLEGLEVVFIVLTFGANQKNLPLAALGAVVAVVLVAIIGVAVRGPLSRVPENTLKFVVGIMLTAFGTFWGAEGAGAVWPGADTSLLVIAPVIAILSLGIAGGMRAYRRAHLPGEAGAPAKVAPSDVKVAAGSAHAHEVGQPTATPTRPEAAAPERQRITAAARLQSFGEFWYDFIIGDDWQIALGVALALLVTFAVSLVSPLAWIVMPIGVVFLLPYGIRRALRA